MQIITSKDNNNIKEIKKLSSKKYRDEKNEYIVEGIKLIKEAIQENASIKQIVICDECAKDGTIDKELMYEIAKYDCIYVSKNVFLSLSEVKSPQGILAVVQKNEFDDKQIDYGEDIIVILDNLQDPGNLGTILRTVDSAGIKQIILSENTADSFNPKVVRSSMGATFRIKIIRSNDLVDTIKNIKKNKFEVVTTSLHTDKNMYDIKLNKKAIVIGNEANGVSEEVLNIADEKVKIPMLGKTESLNASVAVGIIIYEYVRQKIME